MKSPNAKIVAGNGLELQIIGGLERPHSPNGEEALLAAVLADDTPASWALCCQVGIKPKAFYGPANRTVWDVLHALHTRGVSGVSLLHVREELVMQGKLEEIGGFPRLAQITEQIVSTLHVRFLAEQLKLLWDRRGMLDLAAEMREAATAFEGREAFVGTATDIGERLVRLGRLVPTRTLGETIDLVKAEVTAAMDNRIDRTHWVSSGLARFDEKCHPFTGGREDQLVAICGGSGDGKSVALRQIGGEALKQGKRVLSFSRETSTAGFIEMLAASWTDVDLLHPQLWREHKEKFGAECDRMKTSWADKLLFCIEHTPATPLVTVEDLEAQVRQFVNLRGQPDVILVDYLQLFGTRKRLTSNSDRVEYVSHQLQALVRELPGTTMFVAAQLNESGLNELRQVKRDADGKVIHTMPHRGMIRDSQAIYHDADRVIFLYRPPVDCRDAAQTSSSVLKPEIWWVQDKRRRGGVNSVRCWFEKRFTRFVSFGQFEQEEADTRETVDRGQVPAGGVSKADWKQARKKKQP